MAQLSENYNVAGIPLHADTCISSVPLHKLAFQVVVYFR